MLMRHDGAFGKGASPLSVTALEFVVLVLASFRATQLVTRDTILGNLDGNGQPVDGPRARFVIWAENHAPKLADLVECAWCAGTWLSGIALLVFLLAAGRWDDVPWLVHGIEWFAIAGAQGAMSQLVITSKETAEAAGTIADDEREAA